MDTTDGTTRAPTRANETTIGMLEARRKLTNLVGTAHYNNKRHVLTIHGKEYGAVIGPEDLKRLRDLEDADRPATLDAVA